MKKVITLILFTALILALASCQNATDDENLFESKSDTQASSIMPSSEDIVVNKSAYQYGNMQVNLPSGNYMFYNDKIMLEHLNGSYNTLYEYDISSREITTLCKDATCMHGSANCASGGIFGNLEQYNNELYAQNSGGSILKLQNGRFEKIVDGAVNTFFHSNGKIYAVTKDFSLVEFEKGSSKPKILMDEYSGYWNVEHKNYIYANSTDGISRVDLSQSPVKREIISKGVSAVTDPLNETIYYREPTTYELYSCDMNGENDKLLLNKPILRFNFDNEYLYFVLYTDFEMGNKDGKDLYRMEKSANAIPEKIASFPDFISTVYTVPDCKLLFVETTEDFVQDAAQIIYSVSQDGQAVDKLVFPE